MKLPAPETFTDAQINDALVQFLKYGDDTRVPDGTDTRQVKGHLGYFNGSGFAARALRYLLAQRQPSPFPPDNYLNMAMLSGTPNEHVAGMRRCEKLRKDVNALIESRSGGTLEAASSPEYQMALLGAGGYLKVRLCLTFKDNTSEYHKPIPELVPEIPAPLAPEYAPGVPVWPPSCPGSPPPESTDEADLQAALDLDAGKTVDGMVIKWARPKFNYPNTWEVRLKHASSDEFEDADNNDLLVAIRICRTLLKAKLERRQRDAAVTAALNANPSKT